MEAINESQLGNLFIGFVHVFYAQNYTFLDVDCRFRMKDQQLKQKIVKHRVLLFYVFAVLYLSCHLFFSYCMCWSMSIIFCMCQIESWISGLL